MKRFDLRTGIRLLDEMDSPVNGKVKVFQSLGWGNYIQAGETDTTLTQSGGIVFDVWRYAFKKFPRTDDLFINNCLVLGLGGGSCVKLVKKYWPSAIITGIEIDPVMIDMGVKYLGLSPSEVDIKIVNARDFVESALKEGKKYELILVDIYLGDHVPEEFETDAFIQKVKSLLTEKGAVIFNRLYFDMKRGQAMQFRSKLEKVFTHIETVFPQANIMFICRN